MASLEASGQSASCKLFVGGISAQTTTEALKGHFSKYGRITDAVVMSKNGRPRGFGFVTFDAAFPAFLAIAEPQWLDGRLVDVKRAIPGERPQERSSNKIFVGGLPQDVNTEDLKAYFAAYGAVSDAVVMVDRRTNRSRGFGFVRFATGAQGAAAAETVLTNFASHHLAGKWVEVKPATPAAVLQELMPGGGPNSLADVFVDPQLSMYLMDPGCEWERSPDGTASGTAYGTASGSLSPALGQRARGRRGRRRRQSRAEQSDEDEAGNDDDDHCSFTGSSPGSPVWSVCPPGPAASLPFFALPDGATPLTPARPRDGLQVRDSHVRSRGAATCAAASENDPGRANYAGTASPMKIAFRATEAEAKDLLEGFTREDFLSLEVRPWLSAC